MKNKISLLLGFGPDDEENKSSRFKYINVDTLKENYSFSEHPIIANINQDRIVIAQYADDERKQLLRINIIYLKHIIRIQYELE